MVTTCWTTVILLLLLLLVVPMHGMMGVFDILQLDMQRKRTEAERTAV